MLRRACRDDTVRNTFIVPLQFAFLGSGAATFTLDLIFETHVSLPAMIDALELTDYVPALPQPLPVAALVAFELTGRADRPIHRSRPRSAPSAWPRASSSSSASSRVSPHPPGARHSGQRGAAQRDVMDLEAN